MTKAFGKYLLTVLLLFFFVSISCSQDLSKTDLLSIELNKTQNDSIKVNILCKLCWEQWKFAPDMALESAEMSLEISQLSNYSLGIAHSLYNIAIIKKLQGNYNEAIDLFNEAKNYYYKINDTVQMVTCLIGIGDVFYKQNNYVLAFEYFDKALNLIILTDNKKKLSRIYNKFGGIYNNQKQYDKALKYHQKSLEINKALDFKRGMSVNYNNIGNVNYKMKQYAEATVNYKKSLEIKMESNDTLGIASNLNNLGLVFSGQKKYVKALEYFALALHRYREMGDKSGIAMSMVNTANNYLKLGNIPLAIENALNSLIISEDINSKQIQVEAYRILSASYAANGKFKKAWHYQTLYKVYNDSIVNVNVVRQIAEMESKYKMEKQEKEITILNSEKEKQELEMQKQLWQRNMMIGLFFLVLTVSIFIYWGYRNKQKLNKKLKELNLTRSRFFSNISHEFRTPLTLLLGPLEKLLNNPKQQDKETIRLMHRNASRLLVLDNQLLDLAKLESGKQKLTISKSNIIVALKVMTTSFESLAQKQQINFQCHFNNKSVDAYFDQDKLEKIIYNLLANAFKFTSKNGQVTFSLSILSVANRNKLSPRLRKIKGRVACITVSDTGRGITKEHQAFVFDRFYQVESLLNKSIEGTGLGLSLSKELVNLHHGAISLESELGKGSTFKVFIPIDKIAFKTNEIIENSGQLEYTSDYINNLHAENNSENISLSEDNKQGTSHENTLQILIVEDNRDMRAYIRDCFNNEYNILEANDGVDGFNIATNKIPDIIISDLMMPKMDGIELCRQLKADERSSHIPVILLTALSSVEDKILGLEKGADDYIAKPFNRKELLTRVKNLTEQRKLLRERFGKEIRIQAKDITVTSADEKFLNKLIFLIENNIANPDLNVDSLVEAINLSRSQLHRKLKALTDLSATEFIRNIRLKRAAQLLEQHHGNISETVYAVGFNSLSYFSKCFQKQFGISPKKYVAQFP